AARDGSGWGSLAAAFLGAGAEAVVATQWSILDNESTRLVEALYDADVGHDVFRDPAAALASAQARLEGTSPPAVWAAFTVVRAPPAAEQADAPPAAGRADAPPAAGRADAPPAAGRAGAPRGGATGASR
ncbi:MAG TPA: CHAT domain-containing protein, partial [Polyangiaceae bacterium]|nr:CHAT domain-containing protein [Polyangiaceae bacterium]